MSAITKKVIKNTAFEFMVDVEKFENQAKLIEDQDRVLAMHYRAIAREFRLTATYLKDRLDG